MIEENMLRGSLVTSNEAKGGIAYKGERGYSNYEIYVKNGGTMTEQEWLEHFGVDLTDYCKTSEMTTYVNTATGDLEGLETTDKTDLVSAINEHQSSIETLDTKTTPEYCVASINSSPTIATNYFVPLNYIDIKEGNFTLQDGGIKIPAGINHIRVSGNNFIDGFTGGSAYVWGKIYRIRGTAQTIIGTSINGSNSSFLSTPIPASIIDVQEGDIIKLMADGGSGGSIRGYRANTWLMVEKID